MSLRWDPLLVRALARELDERLSGRQARALRLDGARRRLALLLRDATLTWSLHPDGGVPLLLPATPPTPTDLPLPGRVRAVRAPADERIVVVEILPARSRGSRDLVVELLGNQWNALVVERPSGTLRHVLVRREGPRPVRAGALYTPPPPAGREGAEEPLSLDRWMELLAPFPPGQRRRELVRRVAWTSPIVSRALVEGGGDPDRALRAGYELWKRLAHGDPPPAPVLLATPRGLQPYPWFLPNVPCEAHDTLLDTFRALADRADDGQEGDAQGDDALLAPELVRRLDAAVDRALRRVTRLQAELDRLADEADLRARGDLLLARYDQVPPGAARVTLQDFQGGETTLELEPGLSVQDNARALYDEAARVERARERLPGLLREARTRADELERLQERIRNGDVPEDELRRALPPAPRPSRRGEEGPTLPYRTFRSSGGLEIRVGRGARHNDDLTFHHSAPDDVWLHARHTAGAHVILRWSRPGNPPQRDLGEAAILAALHSKARTSGAVPVDWTLRKYVRKPRGSAPGSVVPQRAKTLIVAPDPALAERLAME